VKKIRIAHLIYSFGIGGLEKGITTIVNYGSPEFEHVIVSFIDSKESEKLLIKDIRIITLNKRDGNSFKFILDLSRLLKQLKPDVVHTRNWSGMDGILAAKLAGIQTIIHGEHGWDMLDPFGDNTKRKFVRRFLSKMVQEYTCVSKQIKNWLETDIKVRKKITQIYNGIDIEKYRPAKQDEKIELKHFFSLSKENFVIGIVGRVELIKNHSNLFKAFHLVQQKYSFARLIIVGDGKEIQRLKSEAFENILFFGYRADTDIVMRCMDVFVLPSFNEGISNTILEAMATGLPVIASNVGGNPELVENGVNGFLVDPSDPVQMADRVMGYISRPDIIVRHGEQGRKLAVDKFSINAMVQKYESVYNVI